MTDDTRIYLQAREAELTASIALERKSAEAAQRQMKRSEDNIANLEVRLDEITRQIQSLGVADEDENVIHMHRHKASSRNKPGVRTRPDLRYRQPGPTTDIVAMAYQCIGIEMEQLADRAQAIHKAKGIARATIMKLIRRMIQEGYAYREGTRFYLTPLCKKAWESSPLFRKATANA